MFFKVEKRGKIITTLSLRLFNFLLQGLTYDLSKFSDDLTPFFFFFTLKNHN